MFRRSCSKVECYSEFCEASDAVGLTIEEEDCVKGLIAKVAIGVAALAFVTPLGG